MAHMSGVLRLFHRSWLGLITCLGVDWLLANLMWPHLGWLGWLAVPPVSFIHQQASFSMVSQWRLRSRTASRDTEALFKPLIGLYSVDQGKLEGGTLSQNGRTLKATCKDCGERRTGATNTVNLLPDNEVKMRYYLQVLCTWPSFNKR